MDKIGDTKIKNKHIRFHIRTNEEAKWEIIKYRLWLQNENCENINIINNFI